MSSRLKNWRLYHRALKIIWKKEPGLFISSFAEQVFSAVLPYAYIYISSLIIGELATGCSERWLAYWVVILLATTLAAEMIGAILKRWNNMCADRFHVNRDMIWGEKMFSMSFEKVDSPHVQKILSEIKQNEQFAGYGFTKVIEIYKNSIHEGTQIIAALILACPMFFSDVPASNPKYLFLNNPLCVILIFVVLCGTTLLSPALSNRAKKYWANLAGKATQENRLYSFYGFFAYDNRRAPDIRVYRQNELCREWFFQNNSFGGAGEIARYARGHMGIMNMLSVAVSYVFTVLVYLYVCTKAWAGAFGIGPASRYIGAITSMLHGAAGLVSLWGDIRYNAPFLETIFQFLDMESEPIPKTDSDIFSENDFLIEFRQVYFKYPNAKDWALKNINLKIDKDSSLVIVGKNGSGKSTFIKLLCGLYRPTKGRILFNGKDLSDCNFTAYSRIITTVFQDFNLTAFRIHENIACDRQYDISRVEEAARYVDMNNRIMQYREGYDSYITKNFSLDGIELSGGESQRLAIARALYKNVNAIVMDEPTAAIDPVLENEFLEKINSLSKEKTILFVSHRLSLCTMFDRIIVFREGELVQDGTHLTLRENRDGEYFKLWNVQAEFYAGRE